LEVPTWSPDITVQFEKKKKKDKSKRGLSTAKSNPKAFAFNSGRNASKQIRRNSEKEQKRLHVPLVDRSSAAEEPPPIIVAVTGPPGVRHLQAGVAFAVGLDTLLQVGKTTVIRSLIKHYTKHNLSEVPLLLMNRSIEAKKVALACSDSRADYNYRGQEAPIDVHRGLQRSARHVGCGQGASFAAAFVLVVAGRRACLWFRVYLQLFRIVQATRNIHSAP
jgi:hypothetical protein